MSSTIESLFSIIEPVCHDSELELVDIEEASNQQGVVLRIFVDYLDQSKGPIGLNECAKVSREISAILDVEDPMTCPYALEVSSPGVARPLRTAAHFEVFTGHEAKVSMKRPIDGRKNFKGFIVGLNDERTEVALNVDGHIHNLALQDLSSARLVPDWDAIMNRSAANSSGSKGSNLKKTSPKNGNQADKKQQELSHIQGNAVKA